MTGREQEPRDRDGENWEVADDVLTRPLGAVVSVRFDAATAQKVRRCARSMGLTLSEFVRRATLAVTESPQLLGAIREPGQRPYLAIVGNYGNITWQPQSDDPIAAGETTLGSATPQRVDD